MPIRITDKINKIQALARVNQSRKQLKIKQTEDILTRLAKQEEEQLYLDQAVIRKDILQEFRQKQKESTLLKELKETISLNYLLGSILSHETFIRLTDEVIPNL